MTKNLMIAINNNLIEGILYLTAYTLSCLNLIILTNVYFISFIFLLDSNHFLIDIFNIHSKEISFVFICVIFSFFVLSIFYLSSLGIIEFTKHIIHKYIKRKEENHIKINKFSTHNTSRKIFGKFNANTLYLLLYLFFLVSVILSQTFIYLEPPLYYFLSSDYFLDTKILSAYQLKILYIPSYILITFFASIPIIKKIIIYIKLFEINK